MQFNGKSKYDLKTYDLKTTDINIDLILKSATEFLL